MIRDITNATCRKQNKHKIVSESQYQIQKNDTCHPTAHLYEAEILKNDK